MKRRAYIKTFMLGAAMPFLDFSLGPWKPGVSEGIYFSSSWHAWPDMKWAGPQYWGNRLQDWITVNGELVCDVTGPDRNLHLLPVQNVLKQGDLAVSCRMTILNDSCRSFDQGCAGFIIGSKGRFPDYRSAAVFGEGLRIGLTPQGKLQVGEQFFETTLDSLPEEFTLRVTADLDEKSMTISITGDSGRIHEQESVGFEEGALSGSFALLADFGDTELNEPSVSFSEWEIYGDSLYERKENLFGPVCFAQYTLHDGLLKLTAQLAPVEMIEGHRVYLEFRKADSWVVQEETILDHPGRAVNFRVPDWQSTAGVPYRIRVRLPLQDEQHEYIYEGTIAAEPLDKTQLRVAVFSCNAHYGFPDADIPESLAKLDYDLCVFLGDQFYESTGGFGAMYSGDFDKTCLDYLRKWMMFGWSYRRLFRHKPCAIIPDDHDVYHGNVWGEGGEAADTTLGYGSKAQDTGGYKMDPAWVNMVQYTQTSHLPDPVDPEPAKQGISVYFTQWKYGGISFAILEDRKFKSAPKNILPEEAEVFNGWLMNKKFDIQAFDDAEAELLGERQEKFLEDWVRDWPEGIHMKAVLSQTNFATVATLPEEALNDSVVPSLDIPEPGEYVQGDQPTVDMDSNGWPVGRRNRALRIMRKGFAFHIAGDQHLATLIQYGLDDFEDAGFAFAGPALNNLWPRRFWPPVNSANHSEHEPAYTGNHTDGFGNRFTLHACANPMNMHEEPAILHNRANGYGIVTFNKSSRTIKTECFRRFRDPSTGTSQYPGWPVLIRQEDNYLKNARFSLPRIVCRTTGPSLPVLRVLSAENELIYSLRLPGREYTPKVTGAGNYRIVLEHGMQEKDLGLFEAADSQSQIIEVDL